MSPHVHYIPEQATFLSTVPAAIVGKYDEPYRMVEPGEQVVPVMMSVGRCEDCGQEVMAWTRYSGCGLDGPT